MTDRPILFSAPMVRALLDGWKTQTRRIMKPQPRQTDTGEWYVATSAGFQYLSDPNLAMRIAVGDRLWVRESWQGLTFGDFRPTKHEPCEIRYAATDRCADMDAEARGYSWRPSIFMPRFASRLTLTVTDVRVERLQDISEDDAAAEGWPAPEDRATTGIAEIRDAYPIGWYAWILDSINGRGAWDANPWVAVYEFTVERKNIDEVPA